MKKLSIFLILSLTLAIADQINVSNAGSDTNGDGSSGSPFKTIQYAIEHANTSSGDTILVAVGKYVENINFRGKDIIIGSLTLTTSDKSYVAQTIIDGGSPSNSDSASVVTFPGGETSSAKLVGFTLQNGNGLLINNIRYGGGIYTKSSSPSLKHLIIKNNANSSNANNLYGGGIFFGKKSDALLDSSAIINNGKANDFGRGGGIYIDSYSDVTLDSVLVFNNKADLGGGIYTPSKLVQTKPVLKRVKIISNDASKGGGVFVGGTSTGMVTFYSCDVWNNTAELYGGGFYITRVTNKTEFYDVSIKSNSAEGKGGGIFVYDAEPRIERSLFEGNTSKNGGAIYVEKINAEINLINGVLYNNTATEYGSAISSFNQSTVNVYHTTISNNTSGLNGTLRSDSGSKIYFYNSILWNNVATNQISFGGFKTKSGKFEAKNSVMQGLSNIEISKNIDTVNIDNSNFETDPLFLNAVLNDYTLQRYSPAIGYGTNDASYSPASIPVSLDFNSNARPTGSNPDIGAIENSLDSPANAQPLLNKNISDLSVDEDSGERTVSFTGIADGDFHANQALTVTTTSDNTSLIPNPTIIYNSPNTSGTITFKPTPDMIGTANLNIIVNDNGGSSNGGIDTVSASFKVTVNPIVPDDFKPIQTNIGGLIQGSVTLNGNPASAGDWVAAFDTSSASVGSAPLLNSFGQVRFGVNESNFVLYGDDPSTSNIDEGMNSGEDFTLKLWDASTNQIFVEADNLGKKISHSGWEGTNFIPIKGYDNPEAIYNFVYNIDPIINKCNIKDLNQNQKYEFSLNDFEFLDTDSIPDSNLTLMIDPGSNYAVNGNSIIPESDYTGLIQVGFKINDGFSSSPVFYANINILPLNIAIATPQTVTADEDIDKAITLTGTDVDGDALTYKITTLPANGYLFQTSDGTTKGDTITLVPTTVSDASHRVIYLSAKDGNGDGHGNFGFKVNDGTADSRAAAITVNVNSQPENNEATPQTVTADEDIDKAITLTGTDVDGDALTYKITTLPANGYLFQTSDGTTKGDTITLVPTTVSDASHRVIYLSAKDGNGDGYGNFGFKVNDSTSDSEEGTVTVNVTSQPEDVVATNQTVTADEDIDKAITLTGTDVDGDALTYKITTLPANGYLFQTSDGTTKGDTITLVPTTVSDASHRVIYLSAKDGNGDGYGNFGFKVNNSVINSDEAIVIVNVTIVNDVAVAVSRVVNANEDINKAITLNGTDVDGDSLLYKITTLPANGYLFQTSDGTTKGDTITLVPTTVSDTSHGVIYLSAKDENGVNHGNFGFKVNDGITDSEEAIVTMNVLNVNDLPSASVQIVSADEDIDKTIVLAATDLDGDSLSYKITRLPANGYLFETSDGFTRGDTIISTPTMVSDTLLRLIYISAQDGYGDGHGNFGFKANDGTGDSKEITVTVNVAPKVEDREAIPQTISATEDTDVTITLIGADKDGDPLTYKITTLPANGNLFETNDGLTRGDSIASVPTTISGPVHRIIYISAKDGNGDGHGNFGFKVNDGTADGNEAIVTINVNAVNDPPTPITIISPADSSQIMITINNKDTSRVVFDWTSSIDVEDNELTYLFEYELKMVNINNETINYYDGKDLLYPGLIITYSDILENLDQFQSAGATIYWSVDVTDGIDTVYSTDERVMFVIGKYAALAVDETTIPNEYSLSQNYPNPFNPTTRIQYSLPETGLVQISIYTLMGQKIATLVNRNMAAGRHIITWNGMDDLGNPAGAGLYLYQLQAKDFVKTRKMVFLK